MKQFLIDVSIKCGLLVPIAQYLPVMVAFQGYL